MKVVYVAGPYSAKNEYEVKKNISVAEECAIKIWQAGHAAICPHLNTAHWGNLLTHQQFIDGDLEIISRCDAVFLLPNWARSEGAKQEYMFAHKNGKRIFSVYEELLLWFKTVDDWKNKATDESGCVTAAVPEQSGPKNWIALDRRQEEYEAKQARNGSKISGVGPDAPTVVNDRGAKQSSSPYRSDLLPGKALLHLSHIFQYGAKKYGDNNWRGLAEKDHLNHAMTHLLAYLAKDSQDDHLGHATWRMLAALETKITQEGK